MQWFKFSNLKKKKKTFVFYRNQEKSVLDQIVKEISISSKNYLILTI